MFDIFIQMFVQLIELIPLLIGLYFLFDMVGGLLFNKR